MKIGYLSVNDPSDKRSWSGIHYRMYTALLREGFDVVAIGPVQLSNKRIQNIRHYNRFLSSLHQRLRLGNMLYDHTLFYCKQLARQIEETTKEQHFDILFAPAASACIASLDCKSPIVYLSDATIELLFDNYPGYHGLSSITRRIAKKIETKAIKKSAVQVFSSAWAEKSAIQSFGAKNTRVIRFGANLIPDVPNTRLSHERNKPWKLLFVGVHWERKGGPLAVEALNHLINRGVDVTLTVVGCTPPIEHTSIEVIPFLNKNIPEEEGKLRLLFSEADLFVLPTRGDCTPIVFCEAFAFALPVITTNVGGISSVVKHRETGLVLSADATGENFADSIQEILENPTTLESLSRSAYAEFQEHLNWEKWACSLGEIFQSIPVRG